MVNFGFGEDSLSLPLTVICLSDAASVDVLDHPPLLQHEEAAGLQESRRLEDRSNGVP